MSDERPAGYPQEQEIVSNTVLKRVERQVREMVGNATGLPSSHVIPANEDGPEPSGLFAMVRMANFKVIGRANRRSVTFREMRADLGLSEIDPEVERAETPAEFTDGRINEGVSWSDLSEETLQDNYFWLLSLPCLSHWMIKWERGGATQKALEFILWMHTDEASEWTASLGLHMNEFPQMQDVDLAVFQDWRERAVVDLQIGMLAEALLRDGKILAVSLVVNVDEEDKARIDWTPETSSVEPTQE